MATDELSTGYKQRRSSLRGSLLSYVRNGTEVHAKWPKKRGAAKTQADQDRRDFFAGVQYSYRKLPPQMKVELFNAVKGTPLLPRDLWMSMAAGRFASFTRPDGKVIYSMAQLRDISTILDIVGQDPGDLLARGADFWEAVTAEVAGKVLTAQGVGVPPAWADLPAETPFWQQIPGGPVGKVLTSTGPTAAPDWEDLPPAPNQSLKLLASTTLAAANNTVSFAAIAPTYKDLIVVGQARSNAAATNDIVRCRLNADALGHYDFERENRFGVVQGASATYIEASPIAAATAPANIADTFEMSIVNYAGTVFHKMLRSYGEVETGAAVGGLFRSISSGRWQSAAAVNQIDLITATGQFIIGSTFSLYGRS